jgi:hypothetical protein
MKIPKWLNTKVKDLTLEDAMQAHEDGVDFVCGDGKLVSAQASTRPIITNILNILNGVEA